MQDEAIINREIGERIMEARKARGFTLQQLADLTHVSVPHIKALEAGRYNFTVVQAMRLAEALRMPPEEILLGPRETLLTREQQVVLSLYVKVPAELKPSILNHLEALSSLEHRLSPPGRAERRDQGFLIVVEGIDGVILREQAETLAHQIRGWIGEDGPQVTISREQYDAPLMAFLVEHLSTEACTSLQRTLLFAAELVMRQELTIQPMLAAGGIVIAERYAPSPIVYRRVEGFRDLEYSRFVNSFTLEPDLTLIFEADPAQAARRSTHRQPEAGQFFFPYRRQKQMLLAQAQKVYRLYFDQEYEGDTAMRGQIAWIDGEIDGEERAARAFALVQTALARHHGG